MKYVIAFIFFLGVLMPVFALQDYYKGGNYIQVSQRAEKKACYQAPGEFEEKVEKLQQEWLEFVSDQGVNQAPLNWAAGRAEMYSLCQEAEFIVKRADSSPDYPLDKSGIYSDAKRVERRVREVIQKQEVVLQDAKDALLWRLATPTP